MRRPGQHQRRLDGSVDGHPPAPGAEPSADPGAEPADTERRQRRGARLTEASSAPQRHHPAPLRARTCCEQDGLCRRVTHRASYASSRYSAELLEVRPQRRTERTTCSRYCALDGRQGEEDLTTSHATRVENQARSCRRGHRVRQETVVES